MITPRRLSATDGFILASLGAAVCFFSYDIVRDIGAGEEPAWHIAIEAIIFAAALAALIRQLLAAYRLSREYEREHERRSRLSGQLYEAIQAQFDRWQLSEAEREIALLLIKGLSMREIGALRKVKEKTIRQQAATVYGKSGCASRHELAAHFIQDLLVDAPGLARPTGDSGT